MARILLGVSGGIAAYKAVELVRIATRAGHSVRVVQTRAAQQFVGAATFEGITGAPVLTGEFERDPARGAYPGEPAPDHDPISHLELVRRCDAYVIAPASANTIAKLAAGLADNLLTSAALACTSPLVVAPAMNNAMYEHAATRANLETLRARGVAIVDPGTGELASKGEWGVGRLAEPADILAAVEATLEPRDDYAPRSLDGLRMLVTAGGTREPIDSVRYVGNRSSGRMGFAVAEEAAARGAEVTVVAANVSLPRKDGVRYEDVETAAELEEAARRLFPDADVLVMAAAVADFRPPRPRRRSSRRRARLARAAARAHHRRAGSAVGRAAPRAAPRRLRRRARRGRRRARARKARAQGPHAVVVNDISRDDIGFDAGDNEVTIVTATGQHDLAKAPKSP